MNLLCRGRLKLLVATLTAIVLLTWLYLLAGNLESEYNHANGRPRSPPQSESHCVIFHLCNERAALRFGSEGTENNNYPTVSLQLGSFPLRFPECFPLTS